jgi:hypothetical protein
VALRLFRYIQPLRQQMKTVGMPRKYREKGQVVRVKEQLLFDGEYSPRKQDI